MSQLRLRKKPPGGKLAVAPRQSAAALADLPPVKKAPAARLGYVLAADRASAIDQAIAEFDVPGHLRHRLMALPVDGGWTSNRQDRNSEPCVRAILSPARRSVVCAVQAPEAVDRFAGIESLAGRCLTVLDLARHRLDGAGN
jgi:hypothetical protein